MWCKVQQCRGANGEKLRRDQWSKPVEGDLTIALGQHSFVARLEKPLPAERFETVLYPLGDVRVQTFEDGILVFGYSIVPETPRREVRQVWFAVPVLKG